MKYNLRRITEFNKLILENCCDKDKVAVDATCGNGRDTLFLAQHCQKVYGFDIQKQAIDNTEALLKENGVTNYQLFNCSFAKMEEYVEEGADVIVFNLGYLPGGDKDITTSAEETLEGLKAALGILKPHGTISMTLYWGHPQGKTERKAVLEYCRQLDPGEYHITYLSMPNQDNCPPEIILINN
ncbi:MAG: class I SAM-dependent methyltransferase [Erysipelotrichaceae bacterium]|nr:class I SAM-dependent methyltransferase [Erysipelotrichaceae bacterium]